MLIGLVLAVVLAGGLFGVATAVNKRLPAPNLVAWIMAGYVLRLFLQLFIRDVNFFSHGSGDWILYDELGRLISAVWSRHGFHFVTSDELERLGPTSLPPNLFALVIHLNGGEPARIGCTAIVALAAGLATLNIYALARELGADAKRATLFALIICFEPSFLFYTCDMFKDGLVVCLAIGALASAIRLSSKLTVVHAVIGLVCLWALWYVRYYLIFVTTAPLLVGLAGIGSKDVRKGSLRPLIAVAAFGIVVLGLAAFTDMLQIASARAEETFELGTSSSVLTANAAKGSGVVFDDGGVPYRALPQKLAYTLFSPFLWAGGSLGLQIGKLDVLLWYFMMYRAVRAARVIERRLLLMFASFLVPCTIMYAMSMANVGLIVRQRLPIVAVTAVLAALYEPARRKQTVAVRAPRVRRAIPEREVA